MIVDEFFAKIIYWTGMYDIMKILFYVICITKIINELFLT